MNRRDVKLLALAILVVWGHVALCSGPRCGWAQETDPEGLAFFEQKIRPVLVAECYSCHSEKAPKLRGGLRLDLKAGWVRGGDSGEPVIVPGDVSKSVLLAALRHDDLAMPPGKKLPDAVIADFTAWVKRGAPDPRDGAALELKRANKSWWSLQKLSRAKPPESSGKSAPMKWDGHAIDRFVLAALAEKGLSPNGPADPRTLIRRMTYDVIGLPPTPAEVEAFARACEQGGSEPGSELPRQAVEALVDRLLASPHYGEQWGRHWLDVVRFGESNGFERNVITDDIWPFRDYVIRSLNNDKPFSQFLIEHLAGDVIGRDQPDVEVGAVFLVAGPYDDVGNQDVVAKKQIRAATLDDVITATASAFLGLTVNCARCHHHKFDPIPMEDYYRLRAAFEGVQHGRREVASREERALRAAAVAPLEAERKRLATELESLETSLDRVIRSEAKGRKNTRPAVDSFLTTEEFEPVEARYIRLTMHADTKNPRSAVGSRLVEVEVWSAETPSRNVALSKLGTVAEGERGARADDFPEAYGPQLVIDGSVAEQWFIGNPAELILTLPAVTRVRKLTFTNSRGINFVAQGVQGTTPCEYDISVSLDRRTWKRVAGGADREPISPAHGFERVRREALAVPADQATGWQLEVRQLQQKLDLAQKSLDAQRRKLAAIPPLRTVFIGQHTQPREPTFLHKGGDPTKPGDAVAPGSLSVLAQALPSFTLAAQTPEGERRLALARWIGSDENPLTARVLANRVWQYHFGTGLVDTPSDFGFLGGRPTHPALLDWLAGRLVEHGWRLKPLHREILLSQTYQQAGTFREEAARVDEEARFLWRFPPRRLAAEEVRDTLLAVAGKLDTQAGGPGFRLYKFTQNNVCTYIPLDKHGPETYRRAVYHQNARASVVDLLNDFDLPDNAFAAPRRAVTTTPLQALTLLNHSFTLDMASALAERVRTGSANPTAEQQVKTLYQLVLQRPPTPTEYQAAASLLTRHGLPALCRSLLNVNELVFVD